MKGFTLVELSIVLVIIGLLIGGILVGQSLIDSAKLQTLVRQIQQYDAMILQFQDKYRSMPGDSDLISGGDVDGVIEDDDDQDDEFNNEVANVWADLSATEMKNTSYTSTFSLGIAVGDGSDPSHNTPQAAMGDETHMVVTTISNSGRAFPVGTNVFSLCKRKIATSDVRHVNGGNAFLPADALALEQKIDDASSRDGFIRASNCSGQSSTGADERKSTDNTACIKNIYGNSLDEEYDPLTPTHQCSLVIQVGL